MSRSGLQSHEVSSSAPGGDCGSLSHTPRLSGHSVPMAFRPHPLMLQSWRPPAAWARETPLCPAIKMRGAPGEGAPGEGTACSLPGPWHLLRGKSPAKGKVKACLPVRPLHTRVGPGCPTVPCPAGAEPRWR